MAELSKISFYNINPDSADAEFAFKDLVDEFLKTVPDNLADKITDSNVAKKLEKYADHKVFSLGGKLVLVARSPETDRGYERELFFDGRHFVLWPASNSDSSSIKVGLRKYVNDDENESGRYLSNEDMNALEHLVRTFEHNLTVFGKVKNS